MVTCNSHEMAKGISASKEERKEASRQASRSCYPFLGSKRGRAHFEDGRKEGRETNGWKK